MRWLLVLFGLTVLAMGVCIWMVLGEDEPLIVENTKAKPSRSKSRTSKPTAKHQPRNKQVRRPNLNKQKKQKKPDRPAKDELVDENNVQSFGQEFERKWHDDKKRLGPERHAEMEKMWFEARRPRGSPDNLKKLEKLLEEYPDTNRAGCVAMELGHHYIRSRGMDLKTRREKAGKAWSLATERYKEGLCEYNAPVAGMSKLALATWVYRYSDKARARRTLEEIIEKHEGETDHLGKPLSVTAEKMLKVVK